MDPTPQNPILPQQPPPLLEYAGSKPPPLPGAIPPVSPAPPPPRVVPASGIIYKVDSSRASFAELWRDCRSPLILLVWITKLLRVRLPGSVNDPNVESLRPFQLPFDDLPQDVRDAIEPSIQQIAALGFDSTNSVCHRIVDLFNNSRLSIVTLTRPDGRAIARVHYRTEGTTIPPKTHFYCDILSELADGQFLWTTAARAYLSAPANITVQPLTGQTPAQLWSAHDAAVGARARLIRSREEALELLDRHHAAVRDFHLSRRVFSPLSTTEQQTSAVIESSYAQGAAASFPYPEVLAEMERLQTKKTSWVGGIVVLVISLLLFVGAGTGAGDPQDKQTRSWEALAILVPILLFHEMGHYLAMRVFRYRNLRMFFIPFLGAAVTGQNYSAPGWKKVLVALMGPLPGILLGAVLGVLGIVIHNALLMKIALMALILNGFNLLPLLPLDGGRVVQTLYFSRHHALDVAFRGAAALALLGLSALAGDRIFFFLGIVMLLGIPIAWKIGRIATELRRQGLAPRTETEKIPPEIAQTIITRVKAAFPSGPNRHNKSIAQNSLLVYETLASHPPGVGATIGYSFLHGGAFIVALILALVITVAQHSDFRSFARAAARQPRQTISVTDIVISGGPGVPAAAPFAPHSVIYANFKSTATAKSSFESFRTQLSPQESLQRFGQTLLLSLPKNDETRKSWLQRLETVTPEVRVDAENTGAVAFTLTAIAPTESAAREVEAQANQYFQAPIVFNLIPPWDPTDRRTSDQRQNHDLARSTYHRLRGVGVGAFEHSESKALLKKILEASRRGDLEQAKRLQQQRAQFFKDARQRDLQQLRDAHDGSVDNTLVEQYLAREKSSNRNDAPADEDPDLSSLRPTPPTDPENQRIAARMGQAFPTTAPARGQQMLLSPYATHFGHASRAGLLLEFGYITFADAPEGARALVQWLDSKHCISMKYEFQINNADDLPDDPDAP